MQLGDSLRPVPTMRHGTHATSQGRLPQQGGTFSARLNGLIQGMDIPLPLQIELAPEHYLEVLS
jgi:hypothetical protein